MSIQSIGLLGGTFDPIHNGHCSIAQLAGDHFRLDKVYLVPSKVPPHKHGAVVADAADRLAMTRLITGQNDSFDILTWEFEREGYSYTYDTIREIREEMGPVQVYFIIGADNLSQIVSWYRYELLIREITLCVATRPGFEIAVPEALAGADIKTFPSPQWGVSSTMIRQLLSDGLTCRYLLPEPVYSYIHEHNLYRESA